jgi:hypothetical protein
VHVLYRLRGLMMSGVYAKVLSTTLPCQPRLYRDGSCAKTGEVFDQRMEPSYPFSRLQSSAVMTT